MDYVPNYVPNPAGLEIKKKEYLETETDIRLYNSRRIKKMFKEFNP